MQLREFMLKNGLSAKDLADMLEYHVAYLRPVLNGKKNAGKKLARVVEKVTKGQVKYEDVLDPKPFTITFYPEKKELDKKKIEE